MLTIQIREIDLYYFIQLVLASHSISSNKTVPDIVLGVRSNISAYLVCNAYGIKLDNIPQDPHNNSYNLEFSLDFDSCFVPFKTNKKSDKFITFEINPEGNSVVVSSDVFKTALIDIKSDDYNPNNDILHTLYEVQTINSKEFVKASNCLKSIDSKGRVYCNDSLDQFLTVKDNKLVSVDLIVSENQTSPFTSYLEHITPNHLSAIANFAEHTVEFTNEFVYSINSNGLGLSKTYKQIATTEYVAFDEMSSEEDLVIKFAEGKYLKSYIDPVKTLTDTKLPVVCLNYQSADVIYDEAAFKLDVTLSYFKGEEVIASQVLEDIYVGEEDTIATEEDEYNFFFDPRAVSTFITKLGSKAKLRLGLNNQLLSLRAVDVYPQIVFYVLLYQVILEDEC